MSTEGTPLTRAEARRLREAQQAQQAQEAQEQADAIPAIPRADSGVLRVALPPELGDPEAARPSSRSGFAEVVAERARPEAARDEVRSGTEWERPSRDEGRPPTKSKTNRGRFFLTLAIVVAILGSIGGILAVIGMTQGPRLSQVQVDPAEAIEFSGSRVIFTANQPLAEIDISQVTVSPATEFTIDASGRNVGVRFPTPLDADTEYTVTVAGVTGVGGGAASDLTTSFTTPEAALYLLLRSDGEDQIFRSNIAGDAVPIFTHERINDFRVAGEQIVAAVEEGEETKVLVIDLGSGEVNHELALPGDGEVSTVQVSERGGLVGYIYSDRELSETAGRASVLVTQPISGEGEPSIIEVSGQPASIYEWQFVPDSSSVLFIDFNSALFVADPLTGGELSPLGLAGAIYGIERGSYTAVVERGEGERMRLDLADGSEEPYPPTEPDFGEPYTITAFPSGSTQHVIFRDEYGMPTGEAILIVDDEGNAAPIIEVGQRDSILQACASPSGQYLAVVVFPDMVNNPYDDMLLPLPTRIETHLFDLRNDVSLLAVTGVSTSWCSHLLAY